MLSVLLGFLIKKKRKKERKKKRKEKNLNASVTPVCTVGHTAVQSSAALQSLNVDLGRPLCLPLGHDKGSPI